MNIIEALETDLKPGEYLTRQLWDGEWYLAIGDDEVMKMKTNFYIPGGYYPAIGIHLSQEDLLADDWEVVILEGRRK